MRRNATFALLAPALLLASSFSLGGCSDAGTDAGTAPSEPAVRALASLDPELAERLDHAGHTGHTGHHARKPTLLWIAPHPDDEVAYGSIAGQFGAEWGMDLAFLVLTRGEASTLCYRPDGCLPDLATVRTREMLDATEVLQGHPADVAFLDLPDGTNGFEEFRDPRPVVRAWSRKVGSFDELVARITRAIVRVKPDIVFAHDPRHGDSCHPDHRATGWLVIHALQRLGRRAPPLFVGASRAEVRDGGMGMAPMVPTDPELVTFDASHDGPKLKDAIWEYIPRGVAKHVSQTPPAFLAMLRAAPRDIRKTYWTRLRGFPADTSYDRCPVPFGHGADDVPADDAIGPSRQDASH